MTCVSPLRVFLLRVQTILIFGEQNILIFLEYFDEASARGRDMEQKRGW